MKALPLRVWWFLALALVGALPVSAQVQSAVAGAAHTCALLSNGAVKCWGANRYGQLGLGDTQARGDGPSEMGSDLHAVELGEAATSLAAGAYHTCAVLASGAVKCWGANADGQLGLGDTQARGDSPGEMGNDLPAVALGGTATALTAGGTHTCALLVGGTVKCWGANRYGQLGLGDTQARGDAPGEMGSSLPAVALGGAVQSIQAGNDHTCALLKTGGTVKCWGYGGYGQLGQGDTRARGDGPGEMGSSLPALTFASSAQALAIGADHSCVLLSGDASVRCWGRADRGQLGSGSRTRQLTAGSAPAVVLGQSVDAVSAGGDHTCARLSDSTVRCWGSNAFGELGIGTSSDRGDDPGEVGGTMAASDLPDAPAAMVLGATHTCTLDPSGSLQCWGSGAAGRLGTGTTSNLGDQSGEMGSNLPYLDLGVALPVELSAFTARLDGLRARLAWSTASETNNAGFTLQHQTLDGWHDLGFVPGRGTTTEAQGYAFLTEPLAPGRHRFRLRQHDIDGHVTMGPMVDVEVGVDGAFRLDAAGPEPFAQRTRYALYVTVPQHVRATLHDMLGRQVALVAETDVNGSLSLDLDGGALSPGVYVLRVQGERFQISRAVTRQ